MEKRSNFKIIFKVLKEKVKLKNLLLLIVLFASNTFAWFIFNTKVENSIDVHVRSWKVTLNKGDEPIDDKVSFIIDNIYPGMTTYTDNVTVSNEGEVNASFDYEILSAKILGTEYVTKEGRVEREETVLSTDKTSVELEEWLKTNYPFKIEFTVSNASISAGTGTSSYGITVSWDYESGDDELDTEYGTLAYEFGETNPEDPCIEIEIQINIYQSAS